MSSELNRFEPRMLRPIREMTKAQRQQALVQVAKDLLNSSCPLKKTATQPVAGEGSPSAKLFIIGEAPGRNEDIQGRPFVGAAGRVLTELLQLIQLERQDVFITSIEKFRPPHNRDPKPKEVMACFPYLERQIEIIQPKLIVCLGRHALQRMLEWENMADGKTTAAMNAYRGKVFQGSSGRWYYPVHHPAAVLYGFSRVTLEKDFKRIPEILKKTGYYY